jgi:hypothetical protein
MRYWTERQRLISITYRYITRNLHKWSINFFEEAAATGGTMRFGPNRMVSSGSHCFLEKIYALFMAFSGYVTINNKDQPLPPHPIAHFR